MSPMVPARVGRLILAVQAWATTRPDVPGVALVGSQASETARPDSDVDLVLICDRPEDLTQDTAWPQTFGAPRRMAIEDWGCVTSVRVWYADGLEIELGVTDRGWASAPLDAGTRRVNESGAVVLLDRGVAFEGLA